MKICITNTVIEVDPSAKMFKENLYIGGGILTLGASLLISLLEVSLQTCLLQCNHRTPSAQLIWITIMYISIRTTRISKDNRIVIKKQPDPSTNVTKLSDIFLALGNDEMVQHTSPINNSRLQEILLLI